MLTSEIRYERCKGCGFDRELSSFLRPLDVPWDVPQRPQGAKARHAKLCFHCRQRNAFNDAYAGQWDWAAALNKATAMSVARRKPFDGIWGNLNPHLLRVLDVLQQGRCAVTGLKLLKPDAEMAKLRRTLSKWEESLSPTDRGRIPVVVRVTRELGWDSGNTILIGAAVESLYRHCGGLAGIRQTMRSSVDFRAVIPAKDVVDDTARQLLSGQFDAWRKLNETRIQEEEE